jgi:uncharacterized protein (DUF1810 family)
MTLHEKTSAAEDPFNLARFLEAQQGIYTQAVGELQSGLKTSHWMWFVFPQFAGLGISPTSRKYAIKSLEEARRYLHHPVLGARLIHCTEIVNQLEGRTAHQIFGTPDDMKFRSSMTLFRAVGAPNSVFGSALDKYFSGKADEKTLELIKPLR